jgi:hypothetical protein
MSRMGPRGPNWSRFGEGTITLHLTSGQSIDVQVAWFKHRYHPDHGDEYEWMPHAQDTLPVVPERHLIAAIEHHPTTPAEAERREVS